MILAHAGGVDEIIALIVPVLILGGLWRWGRKRQREETEDHENSSPLEPR